MRLTSRSLVFIISHEFIFIARQNYCSFFNNEKGQIFFHKPNFRYVYMYITDINMNTTKEEKEFVPNLLQHSFLSLVQLFLVFVLLHVCSVCFIVCALTP